MQNPNKILANQTKTHKKDQIPLSNWIHLRVSGMVQHGKMKTKKHRVITILTERSKPNSISRDAEELDKIHHSSRLKTSQKVGIEGT